jgi:hypothetical protein
MTPKQAAALIGCDVSYVRHLCREGKIKARKRKRIDGTAGYTYSITQAEVERVRDTVSGKGWERGKKRRTEK